MGLFTSEEEKLRKAQEARAGQPYDGPACWCDDYQAVPRPGFYALGPHPETGQEGAVLLRDYPLVCVDDAPGDPEDGACHYEYAGPDDNPYRQAGAPVTHVPDTTVVELEAHDAAGTSSMEV